ncbi:MAG: radical SAM family heme chaperone HemW, partial [Bacteroidia bacterium]|nr:radical SAM family heme chaperone HemW [Bacteroidia bacterium]
MAGIYFHIPFCKQACSYCDFHFSTNRKYQAELLELESVELQFYLKRSIFQTVHTIYFGGGTPSLATKSQLGRLLDTVQKFAKIVPNAEITLETNPDDVLQENLKDWLDLGINRLTIGVQSLDDSLLKLLRRNHDANQAEFAIKSAQDTGFQNLTVDLIFGIPGLSTKQWVKQLEVIYSWQVPHLSCYSLTVEPKTILKKQILTGKIAAVDEELSSEQFLAAFDWLSAAGYEHYEISNYAQPGFRAKHN